MTRTLEEIKELLATTYDECTLLDLLEVNTFELVERFSDKIEDNVEKYESLVSDTTEDDSDGES